MPRRPRPKKANKAKRFKFRRNQKKSRVLLDGREVLNWADWHKRRAECWERDKRRCRECGKPLPELTMAEIDHIRKRSLRGGDQLSNLRTLCAGTFGCHAKRHREEEGL
jgi:5-methylcytosine-specific restriction endonuclease McrA